MRKPVLVCAADLSHVPEARRILEGAFEVRLIEPAEAALRDALPEADAYFASLHVRLTRELLETAPRLRAAATPSTGLDHLDLEALAERGIAVLSLKDDRELLDRITATAELTWGLILSCLRRIPAAAAAASRGRWARDEFRGHQLSGKTLGILGCGRLGTMVARYGQAFWMTVIGHDRRPVRLPGVEMVSFGELLERSDILTIHIHLTPENRRLIDRRALARMKPGSVLINTSRGGIIDEDALLEALRSGRIAAAGLDVIDDEWGTDLARHPLAAYSREHENLIITPHIGGVTYESQEMAFAAAAKKLVAFFERQPVK